MKTRPLSFLFLLVQGVSTQSCANQEGGFLGKIWGIKEGRKDFFWAAFLFLTILPSLLLVLSGVFETSFLFYYYGFVCLASTYNLFYY